MAAANKDERSNFLRRFRDKNSQDLRNLTAVQFSEVWAHYDKDGNGYIEGSELDNFLREFVSSVVDKDVAPENAEMPSHKALVKPLGWINNLLGKMGLESKMIDKKSSQTICLHTLIDQTHEAISAAMLAELKQCFMEAYDDNKDGRIEIYELAQLLPMEENFLLLFRVDNPLESSVEFMRLWKKYDKDHSGFIEADELRQFLKDLLGESHKEVSEEKLVEYTSIMLTLFDSNKDGKLQLSEMAKLLPVKENFLSRQVFKGPTNLSKDDIQRVFSMYDRDNNGVIEEEEIHGFLKDLLEMAKEDYDTGDLAQFKDVIMQADINHDGKISRSELTMVLMALAKRGAEEAAAGKPPQPAASS